MDVLTDVARQLRSAGCVWAEDEAALLLAEAPDAATLADWLARRVAGEPLETVIGFAEFCGVRVGLVPGVFVPRQRSALLVRVALKSLTGAGERPAVVDLCCGSGALGLAVARSYGGRLELHAADVDPVATSCAAANLVPVGGVAHTGDLFEALPTELAGRVGVLLVNAPYVPTDRIADLPPEARYHEPRRALDGGTDGLDLHRRVVDGAPRWLSACGVLLLETSRQQADGTVALVAAAGLTGTVVTDDEVGGTVVLAGRPPTATTP